jgi:hypothetical protein
MKNIFLNLSRSSRLTLIIGGAAVAAVLIASAVLYFGAGVLWDYYPSVAKSEWLLANSRPLGVGVCVSSLLLEYRAVKKL